MRKRVTKLDWEYNVDLRAVREHVRSALTFSIFFPILRKSLVVDMRQGPTDGPLVRLLPMARTPGKRLRLLSRMRPHLPRAREMVVIPWPSYVGALVESGVWSDIETRVSESRSTEAKRSLAGVYAKLKQLESDELTALISGERYDAIWTREES